jgi:hypothetical protein
VAVRSSLWLFKIINIYQNNLWPFKNYITFNIFYNIKTNIIVHETCLTIMNGYKLSKDKIYLIKDKK